MTANQYIWVAVAALLLVLLVIVLVLRSRRQAVRFDATAATPPPAPRMAPDAPLVPAVVAPPVGSAAELTRLKGLGPRAATRLAELGVVDLAALAALDDARAAALDAQMGPLAGRLTKDRWVEQAKLLQSGDVAGYEATFGKLGG